MIKDSQNNVELTTEFLKVPGGTNGGSWAARIKGKPLDTSAYNLNKVNGEGLIMLLQRGIPRSR